MRAGFDGFVTAVRQAFETVSSTEARLVATAGLVAGAVVAAWVVVPYAVRGGLRTLRRRVDDRAVVQRFDAASEGVPWDVFVRALVRGLQATTLVVAALVGLILWGFLDVAATLAFALAGVAPVGGRLMLTVALLVAALVAANFLDEWLKAYADEAEYLDQHQEGIVERMLQIAVFGAALVAVLGVWRINPTGLLVGAGFLGIVVGMAARQTLGSVIAGFVLMFSRPMELGDWVEIADEEGIVTDITIVNTRIRSFSGEEVVIPNEKVSNSAITNLTARDHLRLSVEVGVDYEADLERAERLAQEALDDVDGVENTPKPDVIPTAFGDSAVGLRLRYWISPPSAPAKWRTHAAVVRAVKSRFDAAGVKIPYPQRELSGREETDGFRVVRAEGDAGPAADGG
jgi:small-conductance mechanosensitive channel